MALLTLAAAARSEYLAAAIFARVGWRAPQRSSAAGRAPRPVVLCLGRTIFVDDIKAMARFSGQIEYVVVHLQYFERVMRQFFSRKELRALNEENYHHNANTLGQRKRLRNFWLAVLPLLREKLRMAALMSPNFDYVMQQEAAFAAEELGIPFIILHKEGLVGFGGERFAAPYKHFIFPGTAVLLYNETARRTLLASGMPGLSPDKIAVVGAPRLDSYVLQSTRAALSRRIVLFSFSVADRFHYLRGQEVYREITGRARNFHRMVMQFAARHPEMEVVIKTKSAAHYVQYVEDIKKAVFHSQAPRNLVITNSANAEALILSSRAVLGYNSTTLIEGLMAGKVIISPDFSGLIPPDSTDFFQNYPDLLHFARSAEELGRLILKGEAKSVPEKRREEFLSLYVHYADGQASRRAERAIKRAIARKRAEVDYA